jgi:hypothetical protein
MQVRNFWVDIENSSGVKLGRGPLRARNWSQTEKLSASGDFAFEVFLTDPNLDVLREKRVAVCRYVDMYGAVQEFGAGVIDQIVTASSDEGVMVLQVTGNDLTRELTYRSVGSLNLSGVNGAGVLDAPTQIASLAPAGWSITNGTTQTALYAGFDGESVLTALTRCGEHLGEHWRLGGNRTIEWLGLASGFSASGVRAVESVFHAVAVETQPGIALITQVEEQKDTAELLTRIIPRGAGNGGAVLTLKHATDSAPAGYALDTATNTVTRTDAEATYGRIERVLDFREIGPVSNTTPDLQAASNMLLQAAVEHLRRYGNPQRAYRLSLTNTSALLRVGTTVRVVYRKLVDGVPRFDLDASLLLLEVSRSIDADGMQTTGVVVSTSDRLPQSDSSYLAQQIMQSRVLAAHQQLGASVDTLTFRDEMDDAHGASLRFWIGDEYTSLSRVLLRFRVDPLRSTVKSVAGLSITTNAGGGGTSASGGAGTSGSGGGSSPTSSSSGAHYHNVQATPGSGSALTASGGTLYTGAGTPQTFPTQYESASHSHSVTVPDHTHTVPDHTHTINDHTHEIEPEILMVYGIFEESVANTLSLSNLVIQLNNGDDLCPLVSDIGNGWYQLDITSELTDVVFRPRQENNEIAITTATAKTARIEAQITIRGVVQAVAYD